jgi:hypothetical protein
VIECSRCGQQVEHLTALLGHWEEHGGVPAMRYTDEKPLQPNPHALDRERFKRRERYLRDVARTVRVL